ncbi:hypothetical protein SLS53_003141 [Cytospora paraplurivora]|uniref:NADH-ubiquinone oxidoreductase 17.8 kDa subunit n=1 Tax=Cytospora paraplurivora TaxID=2898453 RepID=A0AAN9UK73_9PEZI
MLAVRQRAAYIARRARPANLTLRQATRSYASDHNHGDHHHDHHHAPEVTEPLGASFYGALGALGFSIALYSVSRDENSSLSKWIDSFRLAKVNAWEERNTLRLDMYEKASVDKHLFLTDVKAGKFELRTPELFGAGSPNNVPAGHYINLDKVTAHYRKQYLDEEERKAKKLAAAKEE